MFDHDFGLREGAEGIPQFFVASLAMERDLARQIQFLSWHQLFYVLTELLLEIQYRLDTQYEIEISSSPPASECSWCSDRSFDFRVIGGSF